MAVVVKVMMDGHYDGFNDRSKTGSRQEKDGTPSTLRLPGHTCNYVRQVQMARRRRRKRRTQRSRKRKGGVTGERKNEEILGGARMKYGR